MGLYAIQSPEICVRKKKVTAVTKNLVHGFLNDVITNEKESREKGSYNQKGGKEANTFIELRRENASCKFLTELSCKMSYTCSLSCRFKPFNIFRSTAKDRDT